MKRPKNLVYEPILEVYELYVAVLKHEKTVNDTLQVFGTKKNRADIYQGEISVTSPSVSFGNLRLICQIKDAERKYSFSLLSDFLPRQELLRYDYISDGPKHRNRFDYIPLEEQTVGYPHLHRYNQHGHLCAYQDEWMKLHSTVSSSNITAHFEHFCYIANILTTEGGVPGLETCFIPFAPMPISDPNSGVDFQIWLFNLCYIRSIDISLNPLILSGPIGTGEKHWRS